MILHFKGAQSFQNQYVEGGGSNAFKLHLVCRLSEVNSIPCEFPTCSVGSLLGISALASNSQTVRYEVLYVINIKPMLDA
jgi:hypothetical protein